jgi:hypothetical protein
MKILKIETNSQLEKSLATVFDVALKSAGMQILEHVNFILNSFENLSEPELETKAELVVETQDELVVES